jgi:hypothetical protein
LSTIPSVPTPAAARYSAAAEAAGADQQHLGVEQLLLALEADLRDQQVARVALALLGRESHRPLEVIAAVLPQREAAVHHGHVVVAEQLLHRDGRERGAILRGAVRDHAPAAVRHRSLDARLEVSAWHMDGAGDVPHLILLLLAHVEDHGRLVGIPVAVTMIEQLLDLRRVELLDPGPCFLDQLLA